MFSIKEILIFKKYKKQHAIKTKKSVMWYAIARIFSLGGTKRPKKMYKKLEIGRLKTFFKIQKLNFDVF